MSKTARALSTHWRRDLEAIAALHGFTLAQLQEPTRTDRRVRARADCYRYLHKECGWSTPQIGALFNRDHTTIVWALDYQERRATKLGRAA